MSPNQRLYQLWSKDMRARRPTEHTSRLRSFVWVVVGLLLARSVYVSTIGLKIPGAATHKSKERRVQRLVDNPAIRVRQWYAPWITVVLARIVAHNLPVQLMVDGSKVGFGHQLLMVAGAYRRRALPVAWTWVKGSRGQSRSWKP